MARIAAASKRQRVGGDLEPERLEPRRRQHRREPLLHHVRHHRQRELGTEPLHLALGERRFGKEDVGAEVRERAAPLERLVEAERPARVGAREDEDVGALLAGVDRRPDARQRLRSRHHRLAGGVAAALRRHLVFDHHRGEPGARVALHRALDVDRVAEAGVAVADHRDLRPRRRGCGPDRAARRTR